MPAGTLAVVIAILVVFGAFMVTLAWADRRTRR